MRRFDLRWWASYHHLFVGQRIRQSEGLYYLTDIGFLDTACAVASKLPAFDGPL